MQEWRDVATKSAKYGCVAELPGLTCDGTNIDTDSASDSPLPAIIGGVLLLFMVIAGSILSPVSRFERVSGLRV